jgi:hypothetical protein
MVATNAAALPDRVETQALMQQVRAGDADGFAGWAIVQSRSAATVARGCFIHA